MQVFTVFETFSKRKGNTKAPRFCTKRDFYLTLEMNLNELLLNRVLNVSALSGKCVGVFVGCDGWSLYVLSSTGAPSTTAQLGCTTPGLLPECHSNPVLVVKLSSVTHFFSSQAGTRERCELLSTPRYVTLAAPRSPQFCTALVTLKLRRQYLL